MHEDIYEVHCMRYKIFLRYFYAIALYDRITYRLST